MRSPNQNLNYRAKKMDGSKKFSIDFFDPDWLIDFCSLNFERISMLILYYIKKLL